MQNQLQTALKDYAAFLKAGSAYGASMQALAKSLGGTPCPTTLAEFAKLHAAKYECNYTWDGQGRAVFFNGEESTRETRNDAARKSWARNVMVWFTPAKPKATPAKSMRLSREVRALAEAYLANFKNADEAIKALRAVA